MICFKQLFKCLKKPFSLLDQSLHVYDIDTPLKTAASLFNVMYIYIMYYRIQNAAAPDDPVFALVILAALTAPLHGNLIPVPPFSLLQNNVHFQEKKLKWLTNLLHKITSCIYTQIVHVQFFWLVFSLLWSFISINF